MPRINSFNIKKSDYNFLIKQAQIYGFDSCEEYIKDIINEKRINYRNFQNDYILK